MGKILQETLKKLRIYNITNSTREKISRRGKIWGIYIYETNSVWESYMKAGEYIYIFHQQNKANKHFFFNYFLETQLLNNDMSILTSISKVCQSVIGSTSNPAPGVCGL